MQGDQQTLYELVGGEATFRRLVDVFTQKSKPTLICARIPGRSGSRANAAQFLFLSQFFGGPTTYAEERGHPRLRMRHVPFAIDQQARDHWLSHMLDGDRRRRH